MNEQYEKYADARMEGNFGEMSSWSFVSPYLKEKRVLDIGCSDGLYLRHMREDSLGIEQVSALAESGKRGGLNIINDDVLDAILQLNDCEFDGVLFSHVMEHVESPIVMLREIRRVLQPGGTLVLGLPTERNIYRDILGMDYFNGTHIYSFSVRNSVKLLNETGFKVEKVFFHLPKCRNPLGHSIEKLWNTVKWPFREYCSMAYWVVAIKS